MPILPSTASDLETQRLMIPVDVGISQVEKQQNYFVSLFDWFKTFVNVLARCYFFAIRKYITVVFFCCVCLAWDQLPEHYEINRTAGSPRFINDIDSTILIFIR